MRHQISIQSAASCPPYLYGSYEREAEESWKERQRGSTYVYVYWQLLTYPVRAQTKEETV